MINNLFEMRRPVNIPLVCAHRGVSGANIPCNTKAAFNIALSQGADIIELDVSKSLDNRLYVFHPGMEKPHLGINTQLYNLSSNEIEKLRFINQDNVETSYKISTLEEIFSFLRDKVYINVDKFWTSMEEITFCIKKLGVEKQVIVKTPGEKEYVDELCNIAPDLAYIPMIKNSQRELVNYIAEKDVSFLGIEALFENEKDEIVSDKFIKKLHDRHLLLYGNAILYDEKDVISAGHTDDVALTGDVDTGWGWFDKKRFDIIQTDWCSMLKNYLETEPFPKK